MYQHVQNRFNREHQADLLSDLGPVPALTLSNMELLILRYPSQPGAGRKLKVPSSWKPRVYMELVDLEVVGEQKELI